MGMQDLDVDKCRKTDIVINTYDELLKTINFIDQRNQRQKTKYEDFIKDYVERIGKVGEELYANCEFILLFPFPPLRAVRSHRRLTEDRPISDFISKIYKVAFWCPNLSRKGPIGSVSLVSS